MGASWGFEVFSPINIYNPKLFILSLKNISKGKNVYSEPSS